MLAHARGPEGVQVVPVAADPDGEADRLLDPSLADDAGNHREIGGGLEGEASPDPSAGAGVAGERGGVSLIGLSSSWPIVAHSGRDRGQPGRSRRRRRRRDLSPGRDPSMLGLRISQRTLFQCSPGGSTCRFASRSPPWRASSSPPRSSSWLPTSPLRAPGPGRGHRLPRLVRREPGPGQRQGRRGGRGLSREVPHRAVCRVPDQVARPGEAQQAERRHQGRAGGPDARGRRTRSWPPIPRT